MERCASDFDGAVHLKTVHMFITLKLGLEADSALRQSRPFFLCRYSSDVSNVSGTKVPAEVLKQAQPE